MIKSSRSHLAHFHFILQAAKCKVLKISRKKIKSTKFTESNENGQDFENMICANDDDDETFVKLRKNVQLTQTRNKDQLNRNLRIRSNND